jgi:predicted ATP-dependent endonuclease of OLD family
MRVQTVHLIDFKRFHDLTLDLTGRSTKVVALVGPNGSGKSSVFDAFEEFSSQHKSRGGKVEGYYKKSAYYEVEVAKQYQPNQNIIVKTDQNSIDRKSVYIRSAYRFTARLGINNIRTLPNVEEDGNRPQYLIDTDTRLTENYERLIRQFFGEVYGKDLTGNDWINQNITNLNNVLKSKVAHQEIEWMNLMGNVA